MRVSHNPIARLIVRLRMAWADARGHHGHKWDYEPGEHYLGMRKSKYWAKHHDKK